MGTKVEPAVFAAVSLEFKSVSFLSFASTSCPPVLLFFDESFELSLFLVVLAELDFDLRG